MNVFNGLFLMVEGRYFYCPEATSEITLTEILNEDEIVRKSAIEPPSPFSFYHKTSY